MSATLCFSDVIENSQLFHTSVPLIEIPAQTHPVTIHFSRTTPTDNYVSAAVDKVVQIHRQLPAGSILVFMPGRQEVHTVVSQLAARLSEKATSSFRFPSCCYEQETNNTSALYWRGDSDEESGDDKENFFETNHTQNITDTVVSKTIKSNVVNSPFVFEDEESFNTLNQSPSETNGKTIVSTEQITDIEMAELLGFDSGIGMGTVNPKQSSAEFIKWEGYGSDVSNGIKCSVRLVPLYALLPLKEQSKAFEPPKLNERVIIVATNVAETSLTLPNIRSIFV
jgi:ATP-dependent RNA helicase DHX37/DHR1